MSAASRGLRPTGALPPLGFAARLGLATSVLMTVVCVAQSWILARSDLQHLRRHLAERGFTISEYLAHEAASVLVAGRVDGLHQLAEQAQAQSRIVYSRFFDRHGLLLASMGRPPGAVAPRPAAAGREPIGPIPIGEELWEFQAPVLTADGAAGERVGTVAIGISIESLQALRRNTFATASLFTLLFTLLAVLSAVGLARAITRPLKALAAAADAISQGDFGATVEVSTRDEVGGLARSFNAMVRSLATSHAALAEKVLELEKANRLKSEFLATISHELRTPLNVILGYVELLSEGDGGAITARQSEMLAAIQRYSKLQYDLITNVLDFSRLSSGGISFRVERFELAALLGEIEALYAGHLRHRGVQFSATIAPEVAVLESDRIKVQEIVRNLLDNAVKFTERGRIEVVASPARDAARVVIQVSDTGPGIRPEELPFIFDAFHQIGESSTRGTAGVGLGLSIVKQLVEALGGTITVASQVGAGSTFRVELPRCLKVAPGAEPPAQEMLPAIAALDDVSRNATVIPERASVARLSAPAAQRRLGRAP